MIAETEHEHEGLRPCRFCHARAAVLVVQQIDGVPEADDVCFVRCKFCYAQGPATDSEKRAVERWNDGYSEVFNSVLEALGDLYEAYCREYSGDGTGSDTDAVPIIVSTTETGQALHDLIWAYDTWL